MMRLLLCAIFVFWTQCLSIPLDLIPEDDKCTGIACPKLNCTNTIKKEGECCMSCITVGRCNMILPNQSAIIVTKAIIVNFAISKYNAYFVIHTYMPLLHSQHLYAHFSSLLQILFQKMTNALK